MLFAGRFLAALLLVALVVLSAALPLDHRSSSSSLTSTITSSSPWFCHGIECPDYTVVSRNTSASYELRLYPESLWVSTDLEFDSTEDFQQAVYVGFRRLFAYISGANEEQIKVAMTAPVLNKITPGQGPFCKSNLTLSFYVPLAFQAKGPPKPSADNVYVSTIPQQHVFVYQYSTLPPGPSGASIVADAAALLKVLIPGSSDGSYYYSAQYDPPFRIFNRHDEIWIHAIA